MIGLTKPIRVAQVLGVMNGGGIEQVVMNYYRHIDRSRVQFDFLVGGGSAMVPREEISSLGGRVYMTPSRSNPIAYSSELEHILREGGWPIVHAHMNALSCFPLRAAKRAGVPVRIAHSHSTSGKGEHAKNIVKAVLKTMANRYPTHLMACSTYAGNWLFGKGKSFAVLPNAIDIQSFLSNRKIRSEVRSELGLGNDQFVVGHIGRFAIQKNHAFLLKVFAEVLAYEPDSVLILVGDGPLVEKVREEASSLGIAESVRFLGLRADASRLYQAFDVFCLPSLYEGLPVVSIESQASGTPILSSTEVTREAAVTPLMEFEALSSSCDEWAKHLISMRELSLNVNDENNLIEFDINYNAGKLLDFYESVLVNQG